MFTGLIEDLGQIESQHIEGSTARLVVRANIVGQDATLGASIAVNGCCLTVCAIDGPNLAFDVGDETLRCTNLGQLSNGSVVNLERAIQVGARMGGHFVSGHVDGLGRVVKLERNGDWVHAWFAAPPELIRQMVPKGSIAIDGISLTLVSVTADSFEVMLIPHTLAVTNLGVRQIGDQVNLETDLLAKYVERQLQGFGHRPVV